MSRPMYENSGDRNNEHEIMSSVAGQWGVQFLQVAYCLSHGLHPDVSRKGKGICRMQASQYHMG